MVEPSRAVLVPRTVATAAAEAVTIDMVTEAVIAALDGSTCGQTNPVAPPPNATWLDVLARAGAVPRAVPAARAAA